MQYLVRLTCWIAFPLSKQMLIRYSCLLKGWLYQNGFPSSLTFIMLVLNFLTSCLDTDRNYHHQMMVYSLIYISNISKITFSSWSLNKGFQKQRFYKHLQFLSLKISHPILVSDNDSNNDSTTFNDINFRLMLLVPVQWEQWMS